MALDAVPVVFSYRTLRRIGSRREKPETVEHPNLLSEESNHAQLVSNMVREA